MTKAEAIEAMEKRTKVRADDGYEDAGYIRSIDGDMAIVGWDIGVNAACFIDDLLIA